MSVIFLVVSVWGALCTVNAWRPARRNRLFFAPSFLASWLTIELAGHHLVWQIAATVIFVWAGALDHWAGWIGLAITLLSWAGIIMLIAQGRRTAAILHDALGDHDVEGDPERIPRSRLLMPFVTGRKGVERDRNITYSRVAGRELKLDVYRRSEAGERRPAILQIHGGGWVMGDKREQGIPLLNHLAANGWVGFNANYRLSPAATWPEHLIDLKRAVAWIRGHADEYGVDPGFVAVTGGSAGGHLAAMMGLTGEDVSYQPGFEDADTSVQAVVPFYGLFDMTDRQGVHHKDFLPRFIEPMVIKAFLAEEPQRFADASPIDRVGPDAPPFFVIHGTRDTLAPLEAARLFVERLREASDQAVVYAELRGAQHAFDVFYSVRSNPVIQSVERFLEGVRRQVQDGVLGGEVDRTDLASLSGPGAR